VLTGCCPYEWTWPLGRTGGEEGLLKLFALEPRLKLHQKGIRTLQQQVLYTY